LEPLSAAFRTDIDEVRMMIRNWRMVQSVKFQKDAFDLREFETLNVDLVHAILVLMESSLKYLEVLPRISSALTLALLELQVHCGLKQSRKVHA